MRVLRLNVVGEDVSEWEYFLRGRGFYYIEISDTYDADVETATKDYQGTRGLKVDGVVGNNTYAAAMQDGFNIVKDSSLSKDGPNWPSKPDYHPLDSNEKSHLFTRFSYVPNNTPDNPEAIHVLGSWFQDHITEVNIPQLYDVKGTAGLTHFPFHKLGASQFKGFFQAIENLGFKDRILTWGGSYSARFVRGSRVYLSNHSYGTAFDINVPWNMLGSQPALVGKRGSVRDLVLIAAKFGFYWGGYFRRKDGMHFEISKLMTSEEVASLLKSE